MSGNTLKHTRLRTVYFRMSSLFAGETNHHIPYMKNNRKSNKTHSYPHKSIGSRLPNQDVTIYSRYMNPAPWQNGHWMFGPNQRKMEWNTNKASIQIHTKGMRNSTHIWGQTSDELYAIKTYEQYFHGTSMHCLHHWNTIMRENGFLANMYSMHLRS